MNNAVIFRAVTADAEQHAGGCQGDANREPSDSLSLLIARKGDAFFSGGQWTALASAGCENGCGLF